MDFNSKQMINSKCQYVKKKKVEQIQNESSKLLFRQSYMYHRKNNKSSFLQEFAMYIRSLTPTFAAATKFDKVTYVFLDMIFLKHMEVSSG